jgi:Raf kinase inhibitor-like YbhB/YbcL family protein
MRKMLWLAAAGIAGVMLFRNAARRHEQYPDIITTKRGDSPLAPASFSSFRITSPAFAPGQPIPATYSCEADDKSPPLEIAGAPVGTVSMALIVEDLDSPMPPVFDHWLVWNIPAGTTDIAENTLPLGAVQGKNTLKKVQYSGPCTPNGTHFYHFKLFALDCEIDLPEGSTKPLLKAAMKGHILAECEMLGRYTANRTTRGKLMMEMTAAGARA